MEDKDIRISSMLPHGAVLHDTYRIDDYLSSGGFGNTYVATNIHFDEVVAIKEFFMSGINTRDANNTSISVTVPENRKQFQEQLDKFKKEARRLRRFHNPHIVRVHDFFEENGTAYYVMDYINGQNLNERLKTTKAPLSEAEALDYFSQILDALEAVHKDGIFHMDIKPGNIMVDTDGVAKLIDFGASKQFDSQGGPTTSTSVSYTNGYAPCEQMEQNREKFGPWTDIYSLGATLYNLLTNRRPPMPSDINDDRTDDKHLALPMPGISQHVQNLIRSMMAYSFMDRPKSIGEVKRLLEDDTDVSVKIVEDDKKEETAVVTHEETAPVPPHEPKPKPKPTSKPASPQKGKGRNWKIGAIIAVVTALVIVGIVYGTRSGNENPEQDPTIADSLSQAQRDSVIQQAVDNMVYVEGGTFMMGASDDDSDAENDEYPAHKVTLSSFYLGETEVTQELWLAVMGSNPSEFTGNLQRPVERVSWDDCQEFIAELNRLTGKHFRLPTEAEWEFAARGGNLSQHYKYAGSNNLDEVAWYDYNGPTESTQPVATKKANELGLYDMSGNVWEWCQDWYDDYGSAAQTNPTGPASGSDRVLRGGGWNGDAGRCRVSFRLSDSPSHRYYYLGLRLAL